MAVRNVLTLWGICAVLACNHGCGNDDDPAISDTDTNDTTGELPADVYELDGIDAELPNSDLLPLTEILRDAQIVGLGESVHTSGGYYQAKHRLFRFLVEEMGFRALAIESPWDNARLVNDYLATGEGDPQGAVVEGLYGIWASQSILDLVEWMRSWNVEHPGDQVSFFGFDIKQPDQDLSEIDAFLVKYLPKDAAALIDGLTTCIGGMVEPSCVESDYENCMTGVDSIQSEIEGIEDQFDTPALFQTYEIALMRIIGYRAFEIERYYNYCYPSMYNPYFGHEARDEAMTYVLLKTRGLFYAEKKVAVWAHNSHLGMDYELWIVMGELLSQHLGSDYAPIGLVGYSVWMNFPGWIVGEAPLPTGDNNISVMLHELNRDYLLVDLESMTTEDSFFAPGTEYGLSESGGPTFQVVPAEKYRALVFLDESPPMESLAW